jgi:NADH-quinone oxidoreductase subunit H
MTLLERKLIARIQTRYGPNRAGPFGFFQPVADGLKLAFKEDIRPLAADKVVYFIAPILTVVPALIVMAVVPFGGTIPQGGIVTDPCGIPLVVAPGSCENGRWQGVNIGILYILAVTSISVYGIVLAGWASNNKYSMLGGLRSSAQMISYELALGLSLIPPMMLAGSMSLVQIVEAQRGMWFAFMQPLAALIFMIAALAEVNRAPFDLPEAEQELTAGYHTEYSGMKFALFFMAEYIKMIAVSAIGATLFFGGWLGPGADQFWPLGPIYFFGKTLIFLIIMIWVRATLPRIRYDRLMGFGWKTLLPVSLANVMITAIAIVLSQDAGVRQILEGLRKFFLG